jgi:endoglucanase
MEASSQPTSWRSVLIASVTVVGLAAGALACSTQPKSGDDAVPATPDAVPATTEAAPAITEAAPTSTAPVPATTQATPDTASPPAEGTGGKASLDGNWSTSGSTIVDSDGDQVAIRGVNWFGFETAAAMPHGLWSRNMEDMLDQIAELGFNTIRLPFSSAMLDDGVVPQGINQQENPELVGLTSVELMDRFIDAAGQRGLAVILDRHALAPDDRAHLWYDDQYPQERLVDDWTMLAERYGDRPNVVGADLYNEPHDEACWGCGDPAVDWKAAATVAGDAVHAVEPDWLIFVEGVEHVDGGSCDGADDASCNWWGGNLADAVAEPIELAQENKVVYSPHEYATSVFRQTWFDDPSFPTNMPGIWDGFWGQLERSGSAPVMVGEFGTTLAADVDQVWLRELLAYMAEVGADFTYWSFNPNSGDTGGILQDDWVSVDDAKMSYLAPYLSGPFPPVGAESS